MMRKYNVVKKKSEYQIYEHNTNQVVATYTDASDAYDSAFQLESGSGFDGSTPSFFASNTNYQVAQQVRQIRMGVDLHD